MRHTTERGCSGKQRVFLKALTWPHLWVGIGRNEEPPGYLAPEVPLTILAP